MHKFSPIRELGFEFDNFEAFNDSIRGWSTHFVQVDRGLANVEMRHRMTDEINALNLQFSHSTSSLGAPEPGRRTFGMVDKVLGCSWCGRDVTPNQVLRFDMHEEFDSFTPRGFVARTLSIDEELLASVAQQLGLSPIMDYLDRTDDILSVHPGAMERFRRIYDRPHIGEQDLVETLQAFVLLIADNGATFERIRQKNQSRTVDQALAYIVDNAQLAITVADVCSYLGVNYRTLDRAFWEKLGHGPKASITAVRLHGVRKALLEAEDKSRIVDIAGSWGFWHMSDFARIYHNEFGDLPSTTLKYKRTHITNT